MSNTKRRKLFKSIVAGSGAVITGKTLPDVWIRPVVDYVMLPAHAQTSEEASEQSPECAFYAVEGLPVPGGGTSPLETFIVCAVLCGDGSVADVRFAPVVEGASDRVRTGMIPTDGTQGDMTNTENSPNCSGGPRNEVVPATITDVTSESLVFTLVRPNAGDLEATLERVDSCPEFPPVTGECD